MTAAKIFSAYSLKIKCVYRFFIKNILHKLHIAAILGSMRVKVKTERKRLLNANIMIFIASLASTVDSNKFWLDFIEMMDRINRVCLQSCK